MTSAGVTVEMASELTQVPVKQEEYEATEHAESKERQMIVSREKNHKSKNLGENPPLKAPLNKAL